MRKGVFKVKRTDRPVERLDPGTKLMFSYLDGELESGERTAFESRLEADRELAAEVRAFRSLLAALDRLAAFSPSIDFKVRVLASLRARRSFRGQLRRLFLGSRHPAASNVFDELIEDGLSERRARALAAFVSRDREAAAALAGWKRLHERLGRLPSFQPQAGFDERVMARVSTAPGAVRVPRHTPRWAVKLWPERRQRLAAVMGAAFAPTALAVGFAYTLVSIFSNPLVTPGDALRFVFSKVAGAVSGAADGLFGGLATEFGALGGWGLGGALVPIVVLGFVVLSGLALVSARILYKNLVTNTGLDRGHASV